MLTAPCSCVPGSRVPGPSEPITGRTPAQLARMAEIARDPAFAHFCGNPSLPVGSDYRGPVNVLWYDRSGVLRLERVGVSGRVLRVVAARA